MRAFCANQVLGAAYFDSVRAFRSVGDLESDLVTLLEFVKRDADELVGVEKDIFFASFDFDEPESFIGETGNSSFLHGNEKNSFVIASRQETGDEARSVLPLDQAPV